MKKFKFYLDKKDGSLWIDLGKHGVCYGDNLLIKVGQQWSVDKPFLEEHFEKIKTKYPRKVINHHVK